MLVDDANGNITTSIYQANANRLLAQEDANGNRVSYVYDLAGQTTAIQDARGYFTSMSYDLAGRLQTEMDALARVTSFVYDAAGRNTQKIDAQSRVKTMVYDPVSNLVSILYADGSRVSLQYDVLNRRTTMQDSGGTTTYVYSVRSELLSDTRPGGYVVSREFDAVGNRILLVDSDGGFFTATFDAVNRLSSLLDPDNALTTLQHDAASRRTTLADANGVTRLYQYDSADRLTTQIDQVTATGAPIVTMIDGYDPAGNRTSRNKDGVVTSWLYDAAYRLTGQQQSGAAATFAYDPAGNIASKWQQDGNPPLTMTFDAANQITAMLQGSALTTATFDATGNMTGLNTDGVLTTYTFDDEDRLTGIASSAGVSTYTFDGDGLRRSAFEAGGALTTFVWEGSDYLMEKTPSGTQARYAVIEGEVVSEKRSGVRKLYVPDPLGSTRGLINPTQTQTDTFSFFPYGETQSRTGSTPTPFQFVGTLGYRLDLSGLVYVRARYLDVARGRWMTRDPVGRGVGGPYVYGGNTPAGAVDPAGRQPASRERDCDAELTACIRGVANDFLQCIKDECGIGLPGRTFLLCLVACIAAYLLSCPECAAAAYKSCMKACGLLSGCLTGVCISGCECQEKEEASSCHCAYGFCEYHRKTRACDEHC